MYLARKLARLFLLSVSVSAGSMAVGQNPDQPVRVFIFAGQSNMVGSDSRVDDIQRFPPFAGLESPQTGVRFSYCIGRENKTRSDGWVDLQTVNGVVGPELSFARAVSKTVGGPIAIIKCAAGGTHLGGDWNPDEPTGYEMYPLLLDLVRSSLRELDEQGVPYTIEGFMWHQGENDMFDEAYMASYGKNLKNFMACVRRDLQAPALKFFVGELCTKTIWGMDLRPRMYAISMGQKEAVADDELAEYVPTSHIGVEIGGGVGLHYHYGTLGQLEHGINYANAWLATIGQLPTTNRQLEVWPYPPQSKVKLFVLAGHRNMEGERAFVQQLRSLPDGASLAADKSQVAFRYSLGGGYKTSDGWEPLGPAGPYDTFGPELSFGATLQEKFATPIAIAKFTHSGTQIIDWTPEGSEAKSRNIYPQFLDFMRQSVAELESKGSEVELAGIFYHVGENDMSFAPYRKAAAERLDSMIKASRIDLGRPDLNWFVGQQLPTDDEQLNTIDVVGDIEALAQADDHLIHIKAFNLPEQEKQLVIDAAGIVALGKLLAEAYLEQQ